MKDRLILHLRKTVNLTEEDCALFNDLNEPVIIRKGEYFLKEGQICNRLGFIGTGLFRLFYLSDGKEVNTHFIRENDFVTEYQSFLLQEPSRYYLQALEDSRILILQQNQIQNAYSLSKNWERFGRLIAEQCFIESNKRTESFLFSSAEERYLNLLNQYPDLINRVPLYHIASYLGIERESLSRLRRKMATEK